MGKVLAVGRSSIQYTFSDPQGQFKIVFALAIICSMQYAVHIFICSTQQPQGGARARCAVHLLLELMVRAKQIEPLVIRAERFDVDLPKPPPRI